MSARSAMRALATAPGGSRAKWLVLAAWLIVSVALGPLAGKLGEVEESGPNAFLPGGAESAQVNTELEKFRGEDEIMPAVAVYARGEGATTSADAAKARSDARELNSLAVAGEKVSGPLPAEDGRALMVVVPLDSGDEVKKRLSEVRDTADANAPPGLSVEVGGPAGSLVDSVEVFDSLDATLMLATGTVVTILLLLTYRSPVLWLFPVVSVGFAAVLTQAATYLAARYAGLPLDPQSAGILMVLVFGVGTDYALLLIARYREELRREHDRHTAMRTALRRAGPAVLASAGTVVMGLACLALADINSSRSLGLVGALGVTCAFLAMMTILPALLVIAGRWTFWPFIPRLSPQAASTGSSLADAAGKTAPSGSASPSVTAAVPHTSGATSGTNSVSRSGPGSGPDSGYGVGHGSAPGSASDSAGGPASASGGRGGRGARSAWERIGQTIARRPRFSWLISIGLTAVLALNATGISFGLTDEEMFREKPESVAAQELLSEHYPAGSSDPATLVTSAESAQTVAQAATRVSGVESAEVADRSSDGQLTTVKVVLADAPDSEGAKETVRELRDAVHPIEGAGALVGGTTAEELDTQRAADRDLTTVIPVVLLVVLLVLICLLRSLVAPLILLATVVLSFFGALGASHLLFEHLFGFAGMDWSIPLMGFVFLVALGIDYNIFLMTRVREEAAVRGHTTGVLAGLSNTGGVITSAGIVLAATFAVIASLPLVTMAQLGVLVGVGVLLDTFLVRTVLVPALALDIGRRVWWPSRLARRVHPPAADKNPTPRTVPLPDPRPEAAHQPARRGPSPGGDVQR